MQIHDIKRKNPNKKGRYVGRGGRRGKTAGRGTKGQKARAGAKFRPEIRDVIKRLPKLRGRGKSPLKSIVSKPEVINLEIIDKNFAAGEVVSPETLLKKGLIRRQGGRLPAVKILAEGELAAAKKLSFENCQFSAAARTKIEATGGKIA